MFHFITIVTRPDAYAAMRASMAAVGYAGPASRFTSLDNTASNVYDPYEVLRQVAAGGGIGAGDEPYTVLLHQDLLFDAESSAGVLAARLAELDRADAGWAVAGTAGVDARGDYVAFMTDPRGPVRTPVLPAAVVSLDENLLVVRRSAPVRPTDGLFGFHLYGTDLCLSGRLAGRASYVIALPVRHLSGGDTRGPPFDAARERLMDAWRPRLLVGVVTTTCTAFRVSAWPPLQAVLNTWRFAGLIRRLGAGIVPLPRRWRHRSPER